MCGCDLSFFFNHNTADEWLISDWSSCLCSSDLVVVDGAQLAVQLVILRGKGDRRQDDVALQVAGGLYADVVELARPDADVFVVGEVLGAGIGRVSCRERVCQSVWI